VADAVAVYWKLVAAQMRSQLQYRLSFALDLTGTFLLSFIDFLAVLVIFHNIPRLGGWSVREVAFLYATSSLAFSTCDLLIGHLDLFPRRIRDGTFDVVLLRPRGTLFQVLAGEITLRRVGRIGQASIVLVYALSGLSIPWDAGRVAMLVLMFVSGLVIYGSVWVTGSCLAFWTTEGGEFTNAFTYGGNFLTQYPINIYSEWARRFLAYVVPMAFVSYFPALYVLGKRDPLGLPSFLRFLSPLVAVAALVVAGSVWRLAVRHYRSTGS
jgi:viologen exporter family transport system permease protein